MGRTTQAVQRLVDPCCPASERSLWGIRDAISAERQIKGWTRKKKEALMKGGFGLLHELAQCSLFEHHEVEGCHARESADAISAK